MVHNLALQNSILSQFVAEIRDIQIQKDSLRLRNVQAYQVGKMMRHEMGSFDEGMLSQKS